MKDKSGKELKIGKIYNIPGSNIKVKLTKDFNVKSKCFENPENGYEFEGNRFIGFDGNEVFVDVYPEDD